MNKITKNIKLQNYKTLALCLAIVSTFITSNTSCASGSTFNTSCASESGFQTLLTPYTGLSTIDENVPSHDLPDHTTHFRQPYEEHNRKRSRASRQYLLTKQLYNLVSLRNVMQSILSFTDWLRCNSNYRLQYRDFCRGDTGGHCPPSESIWNPCVQAIKKESNDIEFSDNSGFADACGMYCDLFNKWRATQRELQTQDVSNFFKEKDVGKFFTDCIEKIDQLITNAKKAQANRCAMKEANKGLKKELQKLIDQPYTFRIIEQIREIFLKADYEYGNLKQQLNILRSIQNTPAHSSEEYNRLLQNCAFWETWPADKGQQLEFCINKKALLGQELAEMKKIRQQSLEQLNHARKNNPDLFRLFHLVKILDKVPTSRRGLRYDSDSDDPYVDLNPSNGLEVGGIQLLEPLSDSDPDDSYSDDPYIDLYSDDPYIDLNPSNRLDLHDIQLEPPQRGMPLLPPIQPPTFDPMQPELSLPLSPSAPPHDRTGRTTLPRRRIPRLLRRLPRRLLMSSLNGLVPQGERLLELVRSLGHELATDYS